MGEKSIYPDGGRVNALYPTYCDIAMRAYYDAYLLHKKIKDRDYSGECSKDRRLLEEKILITIVFSAMSIEAFFNDYAAACLGDSEFYDNFDKMSVLSKFKLIAKFILKTDIDKSKSCYSYLKSLFSQRDFYVHCKSKKSSFNGYTKEELEENERLIEELGIVFEEPRLDSDEIKKHLRDGLNALKAIKEITEYFDCYDNNVFAFGKLFFPLEAFYMKSDDNKYKQYVLSELGIKEKDFKRKES